MALQRQIVFWVIALAVFVLTVYVLRGMLLPFVAGLVLAYLLDPVANRLEKLGIGRLGATLLILGLFIFMFVVALLLAVPLLAHQVVAFADKLPGYVTRLQALAAEQGGPLLERFGGDRVLADIQKYLGEIVSQGATWAARFFASLWSGGQALVSILSLLVVTPVVAFYLLLDWERMVSAVDTWLPRAHRDTILAILNDINRAIAGFVRGQAMVCLILGTFYAIGLTVVGLNFGFLIGFTAGILSFIPFVGSLLGLLTSIGVALVQFWPDWTMVLAVLGVFGAGQFLEGNILSPKLVGESVGLHPVWLMFALFAFGSLFGFVGLLLAVPLAAAVGVLVRFAIQQYLESALYSGKHSQETPKSVA